MWKQIRAFLGIRPPKTDLADEIRKQAFEKERIRLAEIEGKNQAKVKSQEFIRQLKKPHQASKPADWQNTLQSISAAIDATFKPTTKPIKIASEDNSDYFTPTSKPIIKNKHKQGKKEHDGISPTF